MSFKERRSQDIGSTARHFASQPHIRPKLVFEDGQYVQSLNGLREKNIPEATSPVAFSAPGSPDKQSLSVSPVAFSAPGSPDEEVIHEVVVRDHQKSDSKD